MDEKELKEYQEKIAGYDAKFAAINTGLPEAGGIAYCTVYSRMGVAFNITGRGVNPVRAAEALIDAIALLSPVYHLTPERQLPQAAAPTETKDVKIVREQGNEKLADNFKAAYEIIPAAPEGKVWETLDADIVKVLPQPDGRTTIQFFVGDHKYADAAVNNWKVESVVGLMKYVTSEPMDKAASYKLPCRVFYTQGKAYTKKDGSEGHYKDVAHIRHIPPVGDVPY